MVAAAAEAMSYLHYTRDTDSLITINKASLIIIITMTTGLDILKSVSLLYTFHASSHWKGAGRGINCHYSQNNNIYKINSYRKAKQPHMRESMQMGSSALREQDWGHAVGFLPVYLFIYLKSFTKPHSMLLAEWGLLRVAAQENMKILPR